MSRSSLGIFLKVPRPGRVKTRLARSIGAESATSLYTAFLRDTVTLASTMPQRQLHLFVDGGPWESDYGAEDVDGSLHVHPQAEGDLGSRLEDAFERVHRHGDTPLLVLGSDSPDLPPAHLRSALEALDSGREAVLGPVADGGVWCIGLDRPRPGFFRDIPWSEADTGSALATRAQELDLALFTAESWFDCDEALDLKALVERLRQSPEAAPRTRSWLDEHFHELHL